MPEKKQKDLPILFAVYRNEISHVSQRGLFAGCVPKNTVVLAPCIEHCTLRNGCCKPRLKVFEEKNAFGLKKASGLWDAPSVQSRKKCAREGVRYAKQG